VKNSHGGPGTDPDATSIQPSQGAGWGAGNVLSSIMTISPLHNQGDCLIDKKPLGAVLCGSRTFLYRLARYRDLSLSCRLSWPCAPGFRRRKAESFSIQVAV
jgi:hypothetical protein